MANFQYKCRDKFSRAVSGTLVAENKDDAAKKLADMGYAPISITEAKEQKTERILGKFRRVSLDELNIFTRQLYSLQKAGMTLLASLNAIAEETKNRHFKTVLDNIAGDIKGGLSFANALRKHNSIFNPIYVSMIAAAETGGNLAEVLERLTLLIEQEIETRNRIKQATRYPLIAFGVLCLAFLILVTFVIPRFAAVYSQFNTALPLPTRILIVISVSFKKFWFLFLTLGGLSIFAFIRYIHSSIGRPWWDNLMLKLPVLGPLLTMMIMSRFARITALLMRSGVPVLEVLELAGATSGNVIISRAIRNIKESVNQGKGLAGPMKLSGLFPSVVVQMVHSGEQVGRVEELLFSVSDYYDRESGYIIRNLTTYLEPILIFILGGMVLVMALGIFLPMWNLIRVFKPS
jgi:MSHA biogenesis protein MshG